MGNKLENKESSALNYDEFGFSSFGVPLRLCLNDQFISYFSHCCDRCLYSLLVQIDLCCQIEMQPLPPPPPSSHSSLRPHPHLPTRLQTLRELARLSQRTNWILLSPLDTSSLALSLHTQVVQVCLPVMAEVLLLSPFSYCLSTECMVSL